eukprot:CAMPEP_0197726904 /NCGR_PEP_ID=MMETSP1434-20131217/17635_1 /TAXON_ID=265543 /ORGANISM="Minutocellus polymorphus, Strain CCMP3303" /LENGTH=258 /DNA_ID=CAMNT_0043312955 /DNA_START=124 /DNA_END=900 /DNA_ORIENTATION=+
MEGMIWNANHVLDSALDPKTNGIPRDLFKACKGVVLLSVIEAGFCFSGNVGTGVVMARADDGTWSPPSAVGLAGMGFGFMFGAETKDILILIMDHNTLQAYSGDGIIKFGGQVGITAGPVGREIDASVAFGTGGAGGAFAYTFSQGLFGGAALEGAAIGSRKGENDRFYGNTVATPQAVLFEKGAVAVPADSGIEDLWKKLELLKEGKTAELSSEQLSKKESMKAEANKAAEVAKASQTDLVPVEESANGAAPMDASF